MEPPQSPSDALSARELEIAHAFSRGENYSQIADRLCIAPSTVRTHLATVYRKLGVTTKIGLHQHLAGTSPVVEPRKAKTGAPSDKPSIAVLAFDNMSADPDQEFFSDGIAEDIITALSRSPWLFVIARATTFTYKGEANNVRQIAEELGVRYVLEGSVRRSGNHIRVTAQLIDGQDGGHVWSERYDRELTDVFEVQDEITRNVVASILTSVHLTAGPAVERSTRPDLTVWELTMRAWHLLYDFSRESYARAQTLLDRALAHDPDSAEATLVLSLIWHHIALLGMTDDFPDAAVRARDLGLRATRLDPRNEYAHWAYGISAIAFGQHDASIAALERAVELNPNCSVAYGSLGTSLGLAGRTEEAIHNQQIAIRSNPRDPSIFFRFSGMAMAHYLAGRHDDAVDWAGRTLHRMPTWYIAHLILIAAHMDAGREAEAMAAANRCREILPDVRIRHLDRVPLKDRDRMEAFRNSLRRAGLPD